MAQSVIYGAGLNESPEAQRRLCSQLKQVNGSRQVEWVVEGTLQVTQVPVG